MSIQNREPSPNRLVVQRIDSPQSWEFTGETAITIGRSSENDIRLASPHVSRSHCVVFYADGQWECSSLGKSGVFIEGVRYIHAIVTNRLVVQLGRSGPKLRLCLPSASADDVSPRDDDSATYDESVTSWLNELKLGNETATLKIWEYYFGFIEVL
jgi:pSer/pThr/pTyr-binding forkhead associated (FHA) protein